MTGSTWQSAALKALVMSLVAVLLLAACGSSTAQLEVATPGGTARPASRFLTPRATPGPVNFPVDDGPHNDLTEWWYYTGHLKAENGNEYGFEFVIFQGNRSGYPPTYAAHFAITDVSKGEFHYDQRTQSDGQPQSSQPIDLVLGDWSLKGDGANDQISASISGYAMNLSLSSNKPPALHSGDGYFEWAPATGSYYYSRTDMTVNGTLTVGGSSQPVTGTAWMDHQWGNFLLFGSGGWDWYSIQLSNNEQIMLWHSRDGKNNVIFGSGTFVDANGKTEQLNLNDFEIKPIRTWTSPQSGATYPSGWTVEIPSKHLTLTLTPVVQDQELDTRPSTGVIYWEGDISINGTENGTPISGKSYVELTGYATNLSSP